MPPARDDDVIVVSPALRATYERARRFARLDATLLITGESGSGKERVARYIHAHSKRSRAPFIAVNTGAIPESLLESELFGYLKGAFTGAMRDAPGLFAAAQHGTLFLDEIGEMPQAMQAKLLRVLQEREVRPVGARVPRPVDVRVIAATNADLRGLVAAHRFREDLYYRLDVVSVRVPPLRERPEDVLPLAEHFLLRASEHQGAPARRLSRAAAEALTRYSWPGNVRELENAMEHAAALTDTAEVARGALPEVVLGGARAPGAAAAAAGTIAGPGDAPAPSPTAAAAGTSAGPAILRTLAEVEREHIEAVLRATGGNRVRAAAILGVAPSTIWRRLQLSAPERTRRRRR